MSTILEALRKARTEPLVDSVEASPAILSAHTHDYLAAFPRDGRDEVQVLRRVVYGAIGIIILLAMLILSLLLRQHNAPAVSIAEPEITTPTPHVSAVEATDLPVPAAPEQPIQIAVITPAALSTPEAEMPVFQPEPVMIPISVGDITSMEEESDSSVRARASQLRDQFASQPVAKPKRTRSSSSQNLGADSIQDLRIGGILWDKDSPMATVEGKVVKPGSTIRGARVLRINKDSVVFELKGQEHTVRQ